MNTAATDKTPWYRQPWPWFFLGLPALTICAGAVTMYYAVSTHDGLVADDYYKQGLGINKQIARSETAQQLGLNGVARLGAQGVDVELASRSGATLPPTLRMVIAHPTRVGQDRKVQLNNQGRGWHGELEPLPPGRWTVSIEDEAGTWRLDATIHTPEDREIKLDAAAFKTVD